MGTITDFDSWLDQADPDDFEEVYALYKAVETGEEYGIYSCKVSPDRTKWFVKAGHTEDTLMLASEKAKGHFLSTIHRRYGDAELDMESWYHYKRNMAKDD
ncbi:MAG: hypothetical protein RKO66_17535 [Candidatus Contendobacter sp.]|nr:hypothetical protein [Candidatus Contendobacter sp.]MDS4057667.1 hypothetical protein [Candidatus Contendobacter sp.]